jgi:peptidase M28-like protein
MNLRIIAWGGFAVALGTTAFLLGPGLEAVEGGRIDDRSYERPADRGHASTADAVLDSARLMRKLSVLSHDSMRGRATGSRGSGMARAFILRQLIEAGVEAVQGGHERSFSLPRGRSGVNVLGLVPGTTERVIVLTAHYDHLGVRGGDIFNGADDNASGTAAVLEIARVLVTQPLESTVVVALFDAEEVGLRGAQAFVQSPPVDFETISLAINLDMVSRSDGVLWASGASHTPALRPLLETVAREAAAAEPPLMLRLGHDRRDAPEGDDWTHSSDHGPFHDAGIPFIYFGVEDHTDYHRPTDDYERIDPGEFVAAVRTILSALRAVDAALPLPQARP